MADFGEYPARRTGPAGGCILQALPDGLKHVRARGNIE
jgi:hypothetical protein